MKRLFKPRRATIVIVLLLAVSTVFLSFNDKDFKIAKNLDIFMTLFREVNLFYVDDTDPEELIEAGIDGMLETLDPYTTFIPESDVDEFKFMTTGEYGGIGALIRKAGNYTIISEPYEGFPAQKIGLMAGDTILFIDTVSIRGKEISDVSALLKGKPKTRVSIKVKRIGVDSVLTYTFNREKVVINNVAYAGVVGNNIGYIRLGNFTKDAAKEVKQAVQQLKDQHVTGLVLDLRGNPGGLLNEAVDIVNIFVPKNLEVVSTKGKRSQWDKSYITQNEPVDTSLPLAILVNRGSASASEIVAGALQDLDRAVIIGQRTFGKGLVQTTRPLSYNTHLKVTTAKYYIPSGRCIQALDYAHRNEDGSVGHIPDSLISEFKTKNGRSVFDGGGIAPDLTTDALTAENITIALFSQNVLFDFATFFVTEHPNIASAEDFQITDGMFEDFVKFAISRNFNYVSATNEKLKELMKTAKAEGYYEIAPDEFSALEKKLVLDRDKDMHVFKDEIKELLKEEIVSRYYYQKGRIEASLESDTELEKAIETLKDTEQMHALLHVPALGAKAVARR